MTMIRYDDVSRVFQLSCVVYNKPGIQLASAAAAVVASIQHIQLNSNGGPVPVAKSGTVADLSEHRSLHLVHRPTTFGVRSQHLV
ncbi:hypothetical protein KIN20_015355 [Parelaphostrongylus tenuis]|uniref:Uncharacterized protein n=1 Tax=Parelaphostrongylus tenuis TaxID=148309 RepID=A0AAD5QNY6_PARTN|nr:hypothetical protein KIN20_015355 [Parelaphostrongylus tenuis]